MKIRFYEVGKDLINKYNDANYDEKFVKELEMDFVPQIGATVCGDEGVWTIADVCYNYGETDEIYGIEVTVIEKC